MTLWQLIFISFILLWSALIHIFYSFLEARNNRQNANRCSPYSKDFKIDDPVVYNDHGDDYFTHINGVYSWEEKLCYSLEAVEFVVWSSKLRHPTPEELGKYFRK